MRNRDVPAAPAKVWATDVVWNGLTKREVAAIAAMQGLCANAESWSNTERLAELAVKQADALFAELDGKAAK